MTDWLTFLTITGQYLRETNRWYFDQWSSASSEPPRWTTWISWTTFSRLGDDAGYWTAELPLKAELKETGTTDGGTWGQPFEYCELAHVIIPRQFTHEWARPGELLKWNHEQDVDGLSQRLNAVGIAHGLSPYALDIKLF